MTGAIAESKDDQGGSIRRKPAWPVVAAVTLPPVVVVVVVVVASLAAGASAPTIVEGDMWVGAEEFGPASSASPEDVQVAHDALHVIGEQCLEADPDRDVIVMSVDSILDFAQRYPTGRFPIDDETATATTLLVVTRDAVEKCAAWAVPEVEAELPADLRRAG